MSSTGDRRVRTQMKYIIYEGYNISIIKLELHIILTKPEIRYKVRESKYGKAHHRFIAI